MHRHIRIDYACTHCILMQSYNSAWMMICMFVCVCACMWCFCGRVREIINLECWMKCMCVAEWSTQRGQWIFLCLTNIAEGLTLDTLPVPPPLNPLPPWSLLHPPLKGQEDSSGVCPPDILFWGRSLHTHTNTHWQTALPTCMHAMCLSLSGVLMCGCDQYTLPQIQPVPILANISIGLPHCIKLHQISWCFHW